MADSNGSGNGKSDGKSHGNGKTQKASKKGSAEAVKQSESTRHGAEHLKPHYWKPGQSGNPKGRPKKPSLWDAVCRKLRKAEEKAAAGVERYDETGRRQRHPTIDEVAGALLEMVMAGDREAASMLKEMGERLDGKVPAKLELTGEDGDAIQIRHQRDRVLGRLDRLTEALESSESHSEPN